MKKYNNAIHHGLNLGERLMIKTLEEMLTIARRIGWGASDILRSYYRGEAFFSDLDVQEKKDGPVTAADVAVNAYILKELQQELDAETFGYLSEETYKEYRDIHGETPLPQDWVWIIDPLDGTRDFIDKTGEYAVHIALVYQNRPVLAVVAWPEADKLYYSRHNGGTFVEDRQGNTRKLQVSDKSAIADLAMVVSRSHRGPRFETLLKKLPCQNQLAVGSIGCKIATIVEQKAEVYIALSGKSAPKDWDFAAPELILTEAGGKYTRFDGSLPLYNQGDINQWGGFLASNGTCHFALCEEATNILANLTPIN